MGKINDDKFSDVFCIVKFQSRIIPGIKLLEAKKFASGSL